jgi:acyl transferase domain-containing protein
MVIIDVNHAAADNDIVISGFSGRFPMSDNIDELKENLFSMADLVQPMEDHKWKNGGCSINITVIVTSLSGIYLD